MADLGAAVPSRLPADSLAHLTRRPEESKILPPREAVDVVDRVEQHQARILPMPGTVSEQVRGCVASCCCGRA